MSGLALCRKCAFTLISAISICRKDAFCSSRLCLNVDDVDEALGLMTSHRVRHLPILDEGQIVGMISIGDAVKATLDETAYENGFLREYIQGRN